jgi:predicted Rossmann fold flavoprotein
MFAVGPTSPKASAMQAPHDVLILGAGAAGLLCAATAAQRGHSVVVLERAPEPGRKILISGGGRCNFTNLSTAPDRFLSANPHFAKSALSRYTPRDFLALVERYGIAWHEKTLGQLFCDGSARQIVAMLLAECAAGGVEVRCDQQIAAVSHADGLFAVTTQRGTATARALVIAAGGPSIPKMVEPRPALVPLTLGGDDVLFRELSGVSAEVVASAGKAAFREAALFTHRGLSGPAILQASSYWRPGDAVKIDFAPDRGGDWLIEGKRSRPRTSLKTALRETLPERLANTLAERVGLAGDLGNQSDKALRAAAAHLHAWEFRPNGSEGFAKAEVTLGGISTAELSSRTMEAIKVPGLYAIGEAVDVTGWLGGYNFQWAWASAVAAGTALAD